MGQVRPKVNKMYVIMLSKFTKKRHKCYLPGTNGKVFVTMNITFHTDVPYYSLESKEISHAFHQAPRFHSNTKPSSDIHRQRLVSFSILVCN